MTSAADGQVVMAMAITEEARERALAAAMVTIRSFRERMDEMSLIAGLGWRASYCLTHEATMAWSYATAGRWHEQEMRSR